MGVIVGSDDSIRDMDDPQAPVGGCRVTFSDTDLELLARHIAARLTADALLDAADVGALLKCHPRTVTEGYAKAPDFPSAIRLAGPSGRRSQPRWQRCDILAWIESHKERRPKNPGRPRKRIEW